MAIIPFSVSTFGIGDNFVRVAFQFQDSNLQMTSCEVTKGQAGNVKIFITDGVESDETSTGFAIAKYGDVIEFNDPDFGDTVYLWPPGVTFRIEYQAKLSGQAANVARENNG